MRLWALITVAISLLSSTPVEKLWKTADILWKSCGKVPFCCGNPVENSPRVLSGAIGTNTTTATISISSLLHNYNCRQRTKVVDASHPALLTAAAPLLHARNLSVLGLGVLVAILLDGYHVATV